ncbi:DsbA family protein [Pseudomonas panipatensis]|uniref:Predicted dithiol-disulfide isomerase, DsbA family n=1 Tax=Pseudomonas panipatensis TaxID=428992 RepID=A0A1G8I4U1_9PSED|nr:DsbA family protein [Pseudomonas panipatensis]SDI13854.1 Predicted dithiol-disulfide isomerase, DsbA family [Pseudomonas panipatensis]SMP76143.1 Predicted dithiol-disulfide isomerase, DsbA family [Pseudomonas panipatensis]
MSVVHIEMTFDFICPWCLIGKRNLEAAVRRLASLRPQVQVQLSWLGMQLLPEVPEQGEPFADFYVRRLGGKRALRARQAEVRAAARRAGVEIDLARIQTMPNSARAHRLFLRAAQLGSAAQSRALLDGLFRAYFQDGEDLGQAGTLRALLRRHGYDPEDFAEALAEASRYFIGRRVGLADISVPLFLVDGRPFALGAQSPEQLLAALCRTLDRQAQAQAQSAQRVSA